MLRIVLMDLAQLCFANDVPLLEEFERATRPPVELIDLALRGCFIGAPPEEPSPVSEAIAGEMIVLDLHNQFGPQWFPFIRAAGAPTAGSAGSTPGKTGRLAQRFQ